MSGFPAGHCRVVACEVDGDDAYVLLNTGSAEHPYLYGGTARREGGGWRDGTSGNGGGWTRTDADDEVGVLSLWDIAPAGADAARVRWGDDVREVRVRDGAFLATWWRVPFPVDSWPEVVAFRIGGEWR